MKNIAKANGKFTPKLYSEVTSKLEGKNLIMSSLSIECLLAVTTFWGLRKFLLHLVDELASWGANCAALVALGVVPGVATESKQEVSR